MAQLNDTTAALVASVVHKRLTVLDLQGLLFAQHSGNEFDDSLARGFLANRQLLDSAWLKLRARPAEDLNTDEQQATQQVLEQAITAARVNEREGLSRNPLKSRRQLTERQQQLGEIQGALLSFSLAYDGFNPGADNNKPGLSPLAEAAPAAEADALAPVQGHEL